MSNTHFSCFLFLGFSCGFLALCFQLNHSSETTNLAPNSSFFKGMEAVALENFSWKVEAFSKLKSKKLSSKAFKFGGYRWKIVLYPKGRNVEYLSIYMKVADSLPAYGWSRFVYFRLALINQVDTRMSIVKETQQKFNAGNSAWGSPSFVPLSKFRDPTQGYLVNDTCIIEAQVSVSKVAFNLADNMVQSTTTSNGDQARQIEVELKEQENAKSNKRDLAEEEIGFIDRDMDAELGCGMDTLKIHRANVPKFGSS
ncbi:hypothetical protein RJT34_19490 [Clitoria ternatea]|uniref:MATH domain-containing protein n=1 Tax=Clitoria ternatea TaxID=43366 RepID=A0AAN9IR51_CLITE